MVARSLDTTAVVVVTGAVEIAKRATSSPVDLLVFTGSTEKGKLVA